MNLRRKGFIFLFSFAFFSFVASNADGIQHIATDSLPLNKQPAVSLLSNDADLKATFLDTEDPADTKIDAPEVIPMMLSLNKQLGASVGSADGVSLASQVHLGPQTDATDTVTTAGSFSLPRDIGSGSILSDAIPNEPLPTKQAATASDTTSASSGPEPTLSVNVNRQFGPPPLVKQLGRSIASFLRQITGGPLMMLSNNLHGLRNNEGSTNKEVNGLMISKDIDIGNMNFPLALGNISFAIDTLQRLNLTNSDSSLLSNLIDTEFAFPSLVTAFLPLPFLASGACTAGKEYVIRRVSDIYDSLGDLECLFAAGLTPTNVGLGYNYGYLLTAANTAWPALVSPLVYQGDYVIRTKCNKKPTFLGTLHVGGVTLGTSEWKIGPLPGEVADGEYYNEKDNLVMDFRHNMRDFCPTEDLSFPFTLRGFLPFRNSFPVINSFVDIGRVVGRDEKDGGIILLNKAMASDPETGFATVLFYAMKNLDPNVNPSFKSGTPVVVEESFTYARKGIRGAIERLGTALEITRGQLVSYLQNVARVVASGQIAVVDPRAFVGLFAELTQLSALLNPLPEAMNFQLRGGLNPDQPISQLIPFLNLDFLSSLLPTNLLSMLIPPIFQREDIN